MNRSHACDATSPAYASWPGDRAATKEVIQPKDKELRCVAAEVEKANCNVEKFEQELLKARHDFKKEDRNFLRADLTNANTDSRKVELPAVHIMQSNVTPDRLSTGPSP